MPTRSESLARLEPVMRRCGALCAAEEFQRAVNVVFHDEESRDYDRTHWALWRDGADQLARVHAGASRSWKPAAALRVLDCGCGTGHSSQALLKSPFGPTVGSLTLLDTSPGMVAAARRRRWPVPVDFRVGTAEERADGEYDLVLLCSVLHHLPDLTGTLAHLASRQPVGGLFVHLYDPQPDNPTLAGRRAEARAAMRSGPFGRLARRVAAGVRRRLGFAEGYLARANAELLRRGVIARPMPDEDLWAVTDIHDTPETGLTIDAVGAALPGYGLVHFHTYSFFGRLRSELPRALRRREDDLARAGDRNGLHFAGAWVKQS